MARRKKDANWEFLQQQSAADNVRTRDVYETQQLERSKMKEKQKPTSRIILTTIIALVFAALFYLVISGITFCVMSLGGAISDGLVGSFGTGSAGTVDLSTLSPGDYNLTGFGTGSGDTILMQVDGPLGTETVSYYSGMSQDGFLASLQEDLGWSLKPGSMFASDGLISPDGQEYSTNGLQTLWTHTHQAWDFCVARGQLFADGVRNPGNGWLDTAAVGYSSEAYSALLDVSGSIQAGIGHYLLPTTGKMAATLVMFAVVWLITFLVLMRNLDAQNQPNELADVNQYPNDQHIALPQEIQARYDWFPDVGAHSSVQVSSMLSHMALRNKGVNQVMFTRRAEKDIKDEDTGDVIYYKGEVLLDEDGEPVTEMVPAIDEKFMTALFEASGAPDDKTIRVFYDPSKIPYNPGSKDRDKLKGCDTVADLINKDWELPEYEPQRPAGAYIVDTQPVNTMV